MMVGSIETTLAVDAERDRIIAEAQAMARDIVAEAERAAQDIVVRAVKIKAEADRALDDAKSKAACIPEASSGGSRACREYRRGSASDRCAGWLKPPTPAIGCRMCRPNMCTRFSKAKEAVRKLELRSEYSRGL
jgi:hypothetical protein